MDIIINQQKLQNCLRILERVVSRNISLPILNTILLQTESGRLRLAATNLEIGINYWVGAKINNNGEIAVPARVFSDFIGNIPDEKINLSVSRNIISINSSNYQTQILGMDTKEFPIIPKIKSGTQIKMNSASLKNGLVGVMDAVAISETRPEISGIFVSIGKNQAEFAATDSFRLAERIINLTNGTERTFIIPRGTALELIKICENLNEDLMITVADNQVLVAGEDFEFISRLIDGHYPEYKKIIPDKYISLARTNKNTLEKNIRMASIFSSNIADIKLKVEKSNLWVSAKNSERGEITTNLPCVAKNDPFEVMINYHYLLDGLKNIPSENVIIHFAGEGSPLVIKGDEAKEQTYVIMPLRR